MLTRTSFSKPGPRQRAGRPALGGPVGSRRLPEHDLAGEEARLADAPMAGDFPLFPLFPQVRRRHFRRCDTRYRWARDFPHFPLPRYPLSCANAPPSRIANLLVGPFSRRLSPFSTVYFGAVDSKVVDESTIWPFSRFFHRLKTAKTVKTAPHRSDVAPRPRVVPRQAGGGRDPN